MAKSLKNIWRIILIVLLLVVTICFAGCSEVQAMTVTNEDGTIDELVYVTLDETAITEAGYSDDIATLKQDIQERSLYYAQSRQRSYNSSVQDAMVQATNQNSRAVYQSLLDGVSIIGDTWEDDVFVIGLRFKNSYAYNYYYYRTIEVESSEGDTESYFFYDKITFTGLTKYVAYSSLYTTLYNYYSSTYPDLVDVGDNTLLYTYITDSGRLKSDADYVTYLNGSYYHTWVVEDTNEVITIYYILANRAHWLIVCIGVGLIIAGVIFVIALITNKHKKKDDLASELGIDLLSEDTTKTDEIDINPSDQDLTQNDNDKNNL